MTTLAPEAPTTDLPVTDDEEPKLAAVIESNKLDIPVDKHRSDKLNGCQFRTNVVDMTRPKAVKKSSLVSCGAQAFVRIVFAGGSELVACGHHYVENEQKLREQALEIHDQRGAINAKSEDSTGPDAG